MSPHSPDIEELALLHYDQTEHHQHDPAHRGEETDQDPLYDGLVELPRLVPQAGAGVEVVGRGEGGVVPLQPGVAALLLIFCLSTRLTSRLVVRLVGVGNFKTEVRP